MLSFNAFCIVNCYKIRTRGNNSREETIWRNIWEGGKREEFVASTIFVILFEFVDSSYKMARLNSKLVVFQFNFKASNIQGSRLLLSNELLILRLVVGESAIRNRKKLVNSVVLQQNSCCQAIEIHVDACVSKQVEVFLVIK